MKSFVIGLVLVMLSSVAGAVAKNPTLDVNMSKVGISNIYGSVDYTYWQVGLELPVINGQSVYGSYKSGSNYGLSESVMQLGYKVEFKK